MLTLARTLVFALLIGLQGPAHETLQAAKDLYASAAYEEALGILTRLRAAEPKPEVDLYRALCLVALGRAGDAEAVVRGTIEAHPAFVPDSGEMPPRVRDLFARARRDLLPEIARRTYLEARAALDQKDGETAQRRFRDLIQLVDSAGSDAGESLTEFRVLAEGFLELTLATAKPAGEPPDDPRPSAPTAPRVIIPPVAIRQAMPQWIPTDAASRLTTFSGSVRVSIATDGSVARVSIEKSIHPAYDRLLLQAAKGWEYLPARSDGLAIASEQVVQVQLKPQP